MPRIAKLDPASVNGLPRLDEIDRRLIAELVADGRATYAALAERVGLSPAAARARVQRLLDERIVTVSARIDPRTAGAAIFEIALRDLEAAPEESLMVGDRASHDGGAPALGITTLLLAPVASADTPVGLARVLALVG